MGFNQLNKFSAPTLETVEILLMQLSSCEIAETQLVKILPLWLMSEMDDVDERIYQFQIGKKFGKFVDAFIKSRVAETQLGKILPLWLKLELDAVDERK